MSQRVIEDLSEAQCYELVRQEVIGRLVFTDEEGPAALPINYGVAGKEIVFRTEIGSHFRDILQNKIAVEVDHTDKETGIGWSVLFRGTGREVDLEEVPGMIRQMGENFPHPWAEGVHNVWVSIMPEKVTGRRLTLPYYAANF